MGSPSIEGSHRAISVLKCPVGRFRRTVEREFYHLERFECPKLSRARVKFGAGNLFLAFECPACKFACPVSGSDLPAGTFGRAIPAFDCPESGFDCPAGAFDAAPIFFDCPVSHFDRPFPGHRCLRGVFSVPLWAEGGGQGERVFRPAEVENAGGGDRFHPV